MLRRSFISVLSCCLFFQMPSVMADESPRFIDVVRVNWNLEPGKVILKEVVASLQNSAIPYWNFELSKRMQTSRTLTLGEVFEDDLTLEKLADCSGLAATRFIDRVKFQIASRKNRVNDLNNRYLVIIVPRINCVWEAISSLNPVNDWKGGMILNGDFSNFIITHELGHALGIGHSNLLRCLNGAQDGPWSSNCTAIEYGGSIDVMGNVETSSPLSTYHQWRIGLLEPNEVKQSWLSESIELTASDTYGGTRAIFLRDGNATYWVEYRRSREGAPYSPGLIIFRTDPPSPSVIESPNPEDRFGFEPGLAVSTDIWMLNLDSYQYSSTGRASGSMSLQKNKSVSFFSGNITIETSLNVNDQKITVKITRRPDNNPPPTPLLTDASTWRFPQEEIVAKGYEDRESTIKSFEAQIDGKVMPIDSELDVSTTPTYLDPFLTRRTVYQKNLPEGRYNLAIRAIDIWGNKSPWSSSINVLIDRGLPIVKSDSIVTGVTSDLIDISLSSIKDEGSNLCSTQIANDLGFILQKSSKKVAPNFLFKKNTTSKNSIYTFDCLGNGVTGDFSLTNVYSPATLMKRTGKWTTSKLIEGALTCEGKCTASLSVTGRVSALVGEGNPALALTGKLVANIAASSIKQLRNGATIDVGPRKKVLRISGSNFTLVGFVSVDLSITNLQSVARLTGATDASISDPLQQNMSRFGINGEDFSSGWTVLPMPRGTTLQDPTLDLCSASYKSELGRQYRRQVSVTNPTMNYVFLSSEVVKYKDLSSSQTALAELKSNFSECVKNKGGIESSGTFVDYSFSSIPTSSVKLVDENSRVLVRAQIGKGASARQLLAFYQFNGEMFTGLYVVRAGEIGFADSEVMNWFDVASILAQRLETKF